MKSTDNVKTIARNSGGAPIGNMNAVKHGVYSVRLVSDEERELYDSRLSRFRKDFPNTDDSMLQEAALYYVRVRRALDSGSIDGFRKMDSKLRKVLKKIRFPKPEVCEKNSVMTVEDWMDSRLGRMK
ncbi:MAG: hypothetical protein ACYC0V_21435 [Armatimonadota bacterium]